MCVCGFGGRHAIAIQALIRQHNPSNTDAYASTMGVQAYLPGKLASVMVSLWFYLLVIKLRALIV